MGSKLMAIVAERERGRVYIAPTQEQENIVGEAAVTWKPAAVMPDNPRWFSPPLYGLTTFGDLFTPRQLVALTTFSDLVGEAVERVRRDAEAVSAQSGGLPQDDRPLREDGRGPRAYAESVGVYLGFLIDQISHYSSSICGWHNVKTQMRNVFARQAIPMIWDYAESNIFSGSTCSFHNLLSRLT